MYDQASLTRSSHVSLISIGRPPTALEGPDVLLDVPLHPEPPDQEPANDGDGEPGRHVDKGDPGPEEAPQQDQRDLVDHRAADEEGERHPERHPGLDEADEERDRRARAERGHDPEAGSADRPDELPATDEGGADLLGREEAPDERDGRDDAEEEQEDLGHVVDEEGDGLAKVGALLQAQQVEGEPGGKRGGEEPGDEPPDDREQDDQRERQPRVADGQRRHRRSSASASAAFVQAASSRS